MCHQNKLRHAFSLLQGMGALTAAGRLAAEPGEWGRLSRVTDAVRVERRYATVHRLEVVVCEHLVMAGSLCRPTPCPPVIEPPGRYRIPGSLRLIPSPFFFAFVALSSKSTSGWRLPSPAWKTLRDPDARLSERAEYVVEYFR